MVPSHGSAVFVFAVAAVQLNRFAVWGMEVGFGPRLSAVAHRLPISEPLLDDKPFQRCQPMLIVMRSIIRLPAIFGGLELIGQCGGPFLPREVPVFGELDGERKRLCLPWFGKHRSAFIARQAWQQCEVLVLRRCGIRLTQDNRPTCRYTPHPALPPPRPRARARRSGPNRDAAA